MKPPEKIIKIFESSQFFLAHAHLGPDADSVGSILALKLGLESIGKVVSLFSEDPLPTNYHFLPSVNDIQNIEMANALTQNFDIYVTLDTAKWSLVTHREPPLIPSKPIVNIDHHPESINTKIKWVDPKASCCAEMIYHLLTALKIPITPSIATCLICGILNDTDNFQNTNTTPQILTLCAKLQKLGGDYNRSVIEISKSYQFTELKIWSLLLKNLRISPDNDYVWSVLSYSEWNDCQSSAKLGSFANAILSRVSGTRFGAVIVEKKPGETKGALRARFPQVDVSRIASFLNGGGHKAAAGFRLEKNASLAEKDFLRAIHTLKATNKL